MTRSEVKGIIPEITDEQLEKVISINGADINKAKASVKNLETELETLKANNSDLKNQLDEMGKSVHTAEEYKAEIEALKKQYQEQTEKAEAERKAKEEAARIEARFNNVVGEKKFIHPAIKSEYLKKFTEAIQTEENAGRSDSDIFESLSKDDLKAFENVTPIKLGGLNAGGITSDKKAVTKEDIMSIKNAKERHRAMMENAELFGIELEGSK